ncbi:endochitinase A-like [Nilaparvata lugens]|uniref:endochitinase A-like n=1 Tax=Nilaparvata lugens TaxID=108931 RepID=UPI00193DB113|nr:endochitinase A-like [Nilaparvata lugens]
MVKILRNCDPMADCKPVVFMSCFLLIFWLLLSYVTNSYFAIFLMVSNFILIFGCCVSLSGYVVGQLIDTRRDAGQLIEVTTISAPQPYVRPPEYPPTYDEAIRYNWQHCRNQNGADGVVLCIPLENDQRITSIYPMNPRVNPPYGAPVETPHTQIAYNGFPPSIPTYEMSTSTSTTIGTPLTLPPRSNIVSDRETPSTDLEPTPTIHTLTPLQESTNMNDDLEIVTVIPEASSPSRTFTSMSSSRSENIVSSNLEDHTTTSVNTDPQKTPHISRLRVSSESTELGSGGNESVEKLERFSESVSKDQHGTDLEVSADHSTSSQDLEFPRMTSSLPSRHHTLLSRSVSFPGVR